MIRILSQNRDGDLVSVYLLWWWGSDLKCWIHWQEESTSSVCLELWKLPLLDRDFQCSTGILNLLDLNSNPRELKLEGKCSTEILKSPRLMFVSTWIFNILCFVSHISHCCLKHNFEKTENARKVFNRDLKITFRQADSPVQRILLNPFHSKELRVSYFP